MGKIRKISATGSEPVKTALTVQKTVGATSITVNSIEGWHTGTGSDDEVPFVIYAVKPTGEIIAGSQSSWMGVVSRSSSTINNLRLTGGQDQIYPVGSKVVATSTAAWANELAEALLVSHNPDGSLKTQDVPNNSIDGVKLKDNTVDSTKIKDGSIEPGKLRHTAYSTSEKIIGSWIDGRPIYRKVLRVDRLPNNTQLNISHGVSNFDFALKSWGYAVDSVGTSIGLPFIHESASGVKITANRTQVSVGTSRDWSSFGNGYLVIEYVKNR